MRRDAAIRRMTAYIRETGATATVERKTAGAWQVTGQDVPLMVESVSSGSTPDAFESTAGAFGPLTLTFPYGTDIQEGDRVGITAPLGSDPGRVIVTALRHSSLDVATQAAAMLESSGVETYPLVIERWSDADGTYTTIWSGDAQVTTSPVGQVTTTDQGATGTRVEGTVTITPPPQAALGVGDWITGIPWASGVQITAVHPPVGDRQDVIFRFTQGGV